MTGVDAVIGDHTDIQVLATRPNGVLVTENRSKGVRFTRVRLVVDTARSKVVYKTADFHQPWTIGVTPDPGDPGPHRRAERAAGADPRHRDRRLDGGHPAGRRLRHRERPAPASRWSATSSPTRCGRPTATDFAITNSGGLRADLTCPATDNPDDFCPAYTPPPFPITRGQVLAVLPFGNVVVTLEINGAELKAMLENGVSRDAGGQRRFPQVSGLCFTYDITAPAGQPGHRRRPPGRRRHLHGRAGRPDRRRDLHVCDNDFMATGGDGYPNLSSRWPPDLDGPGRGELHRRQQPSARRSRAASSAPARAARW